MGNKSSDLSSIITNDIFIETKSENGSKSIYYIDKNKYFDVLDKLTNFYTLKKMECVKNAFTGDMILDIELIKNDLKKYEKNMKTEDFIYLSKQGKYTIKDLNHGLYLRLKGLCEKNPYGSNDIKGGKKSKSKKSKSKKSKSKKSKSKKSKSKKSKKY